MPIRIPLHLSSYIPGQLELPTFATHATIELGYLAVVFGIQSFMKQHQPYKVVTLFRAYNILLCIGSALLLGFLHVYHHYMTAALAYHGFDAQVPGSWSIIMINLAVHVVMYYYYYAAAGGARFWWKKHLTTVQITQFVIDILLILHGGYNNYAYNYNRRLPHWGNCAAGNFRGGTIPGAILASLIFLSYLALFINYYNQTYKKPSSTHDYANAQNHSTRSRMNGTGYDTSIASHFASN
ncbi:hypothetical protein NP233_g447 [Leucocoprinus birnbaumii]|uniref:Elongation of fatty acids protein n=1 Tax=Leucocoprinus birnbaumii TaxID=56174 RepID=A0AAD5W3T0_9AGAR|nr:hypothetical protein NP233_g447 [Leucocoprinus birnbaumii]